MAAFPSCGREAFMADWETMLNDTSVLTQTILYRGEVAGHIMSPIHSGRRVVAYWLGQQFWGKGIATHALKAFLSQVPSRPIYAHVARHNPGSVRVLEKCGFQVDEEFDEASSAGEEPIRWLRLKLDDTTIEIT